MFLSYRVDVDSLLDASKGQIRIWRSSSPLACGCRWCVTYDDYNKPIQSDQNNHPDIFCVQRKEHQTNTGEKVNRE